MKGKELFAEELEASISNTPVASKPNVSIDERRKYPTRIPLELRLRVTTPNQNEAGRSLDVSVTGLLIETSAALSPHERLILTVAHPGGETPVNICCEVARVAQEAGGGCFGLRILTDDNLIWQNFLRLLVLM